MNMKRIFALTLSAFVVLIAILRLISSSIDYSEMSQSNMEWIGRTNICLFSLEVVYILLFVWLAWFYIKLFYNNTVEYWTLYSWSTSLLLVLILLSVIYLLPAVLYLNSGMLFAQAYALHANEIIQVLPDLTLNDFLTSFMKDGGKDNVPPQQIPPFNGHTAVAGSINGKFYSCIDVAKMLDGVPGGRTAQWIMGTPDAICKPNETGSPPPATESKNPSKK